jgi:serine/threonine protein kinase
MTVMPSLQAPSSETMVPASSRPILAGTIAPQTEKPLQETVAPMSRPTLQETNIPVSAAKPPPQEIASAGAGCSRCAIDHAKGSAECPGSRIGRTIAGKYRVLRLLGAGGMGAVYEVEHLTLRRRSALKMLLPRMAQNEEVNRRFEEEARRAALVKHPHIIEVSDLGRDSDGCAYMEMELLEGKSVTDLSADGLMPIEQALQIMKEALEALSYAHQKGLVHRDLKPDNLFYAKDPGGNYKTKLLDFGIAKLNDGADHSMTQTGSIMGTPYYMSPEQAIDSKKVDHRSDIYSMGATFYEMLTKRRPVEGATLNELLIKLLDDRISRNPAQIRQDVPEWLDAIIAKSMAKDPAARPQSADEMLQSLRERAAPAAAPASTAQLVPAKKSNQKLFLFGGAIIAATAAVGVIALSSSGAAPTTKVTSPQIETPKSNGSKAEPSANLPAEACAPIRKTTWKKTTGKAIASAKESQEQLCHNALRAAKEEAIRQTLCLSPDDPVYHEPPKIQSGCEEELREMVRVLSWKAQIIASDDVQTKPVDGGCEVTGRFQVMPATKRACEVKITSVPPVMKSWRQGDKQEEYLFTASPDSEREKSDLYLFTLLPGELYPFWDDTGTYKLHGEIKELTSGKLKDFANAKHLPLQVGFETKALARNALLDGRRHSCEVLFAAALPEKSAMSFTSTKGDDVERVGSLIGQLQSIAGGENDLCWDFTTYEVVP